MLSVDDEPDPGPNCFVILTGFSSLELFKHLGSIKLRVNALFRVLDNDNISEKSNKKNEGK